MHNIKKHIELSIIKDKLIQQFRHFYSCTKPHPEQSFIGLPYHAGVPEHLDVPNGIGLLAAGACSVLLVFDLKIPLCILRYTIRSGVAASSIPSQSRRAT